MFQQIWREILVFRGINCFHCKNENAVNKLTPKELVFTGYNAYNVEKLDIRVCEICYEEVKQTVLETEQGAAQWDEDRKLERSRGKDITIN
ncbi:hypothetical protein EP18_14175 [Lysinibacillus sphaericus]|nr:hypothetical protein [Lysinibacillus sphaericus]KEK10200.1 hypothetical protein EP18_18675 [Lysinibacillus sphaericus]KEK11117.1 hypothetical protein EP18_14175 [Lysinibacillus sphaericus]